MPYRVALLSAIQEPWTGMRPVRIGRVPPTLPTPDLYLVVERDDEPVVRIDVYGSEGPFRDVIVWQDLVVVGLGAELYLVPVDGRDPTVVAIDWYLGQVWPLPDRLLVADASHLHCFDARGDGVWRSDRLGFDGVRVERIENDLIEGTGDMDPPGGWRPFRLLLASGATHGVSP